MTRGVYLLVFLIIGIVSLGDAWSRRAEDSVVLVNTVFRHGDRTPTNIVDDIFPQNHFINSTFYPYGVGHLTNVGKRRAYQLGEVLRNRYDKHLGDVYLPNEVKARSSSIIRAKMTLLLVLGALYPPARIQQWKPDLNWQPINIINLPIPDDGLLLPLGCRLHKEAMTELQNREDVKNILNEYNDLAADILTANGKEMTSLWDLFTLYNNLEALHYMGYTLPRWTKEFYPAGRLREATVLQFRMLSYTAKLNRLNGGVLLNRMINDMKEAIDGVSNGRKINLFSAHDLNVAGLLQALGVYNDEIPEYASSVILELHRKEDKYYVKVLHYLGISNKMRELKIPGCSVLCPFDKFVELRKESIPTKEELICDSPEPFEL